MKYLIVINLRTLLGTPATLPKTLSGEAAIQLKKERNENSRECCLQKVQHFNVHKAKI